MGEANFYYFTCLKFVFLASSVLFDIDFKTFVGE